jgi:hypothetical protein
MSFSKAPRFGKLNFIQEKPVKINTVSLVLVESNRDNGYRYSFVDESNDEHANESRKKLRAELNNLHVQKLNINAKINKLTDILVNPKQASEIRYDVEYIKFRGFGY